MDFRRADGGQCRGWRLLGGPRIHARRSDAYIPRRIWVIDQAARNSLGGEALLIGDSISERSGIVTHCGGPIFNAGVSMARVRDLSKPTPAWVKELDPAEIVIALGTNDARLRATPQEFTTDYRAIVNEVAGRRLTLVSIPKVDSRSSISPQKIDELNRIIATIGRQVGATVVPSGAYSTIDGTHPDIHGAAQWRAALERVCAHRST